MKRVEDYKKKLPIVELYTAVQSEGSRAGMPTVVVRTTGCTHRCYFGEGGWCDSWQTSIHPEKGGFSFSDVERMYDNNPHIKEMMLTGGSPSMHPTLVNELAHFAEKRDIIVTMETEGSHYLETDFKIDLLSISPKFSNSVPKLGVSTPMGAATTQRMIDKHNKFRVNVKAIAKSIGYHKDFQLKIVWDGEDELIMSEIREFIDELADELEHICYGSCKSRDFIKSLLEDKVYIMPAGASREALFKSYAKVFDWVRDNGFKMTWRPHIIAFEDKRFV